MKQYLRYICFLLILPLTVKLYCQRSVDPELISDIAEELAGDEQDPDAVSVLIDELTELSGNPVSINSGLYNEISRLFFLSDFQIKSLTDHISQTGNIVSIYEIASIPGFDRALAEMTAPFISLDVKSEKNHKPGRLYNNIISNLIVSPGEKDTTLQGPAFKCLTRYKLNAGSLEGGLLFEKDPGERFFTTSTILPDFFSAHISYSSTGFLRKVIIGDFSSRFGQGTNINTGLRRVLSLTMPGYLAARNEIRAYNSTDENNFFRGAAAELAFGKFKTHILYSCNKIDANLTNPADTSVATVESLYTTGLHSSDNQILKKDVLTESTFGLNLLYDFSSIRTGLTFSCTSFSLAFEPASGSSSGLFNFQGKESQVLSLYYSSIPGRILLYGELSVTSDYKQALIQGITLRPADRLTLNLLFRKYDPGFISFHGNGQGTSSSNSNEKGILGNFTFEAASHLFVSAGADLSYYPWLRYRCSFPSASRKQEVKIRFLPSEILSFELLYSLRTSMFDSRSDPGVAGIYEAHSRMVKGSVKYIIGDRLTLMTRTDYKICGPVRARGALLLQDIIYKSSHLPLTVWFRYCIFDTDNWDARLYTYENDLINSFSIPALSGSGSRTYIMIRWGEGKFLDVRCKYGVTSIIREGDLPDDNDELRFQLSFRF